jgi:AraC-like DNA-binding protein
MSYPFYLAENLVAMAASRDLVAFTNLARRNFEVIMNTHSQSGTMRKLRVAQLESLISRAVYRAGGNPDLLFEMSMVFLEKISKLRVNQREELKHVLTTFCARSLELVPETPQNHPNLLQRFLHELEQDNEGQLSVAMAARKLNVSTSYLCRAIKLATGRRPSEYIRLAKLSQARNLLARTSVTNAALESGFHKVSAFIELFRKHYGETPGVYRRRILVGSLSQPS